MDMQEQEQIQSQTPPLSMEDALEMKQELLTKERTENKDLEVMLQELEHGSTQAYLQQLSGIKRVIAEVKEVLGYGIEHDYQKHLTRLGAMSQQLRVAVDNTVGLIAEYKQREKETHGEYARNKKLLLLNYSIDTAKQKQLAEKQARLSALEAPSVLGSSNTAESLNLEDEITELEEDRWNLGLESDDSAMKYKVAESSHLMHQQLRKNLQGLFRDLQRQRTMFDAHVEVARAQERIVGKLKGVHSVALLYAKAGTLIQQLGAFQERLQRGLEPVPYDFRIAKPDIHQREQPGNRPYWMTVVAEIQQKR